MRLNPGRRARAAEPGAAEPAAAPEPDGPQVVYVSPLKALAVDIWQNLETPLAEIAADGRATRAARAGHPGGGPDRRHRRPPNGPRCSSGRPNFLITTPESLYLLVTAERTRAMLAPARTVIVDEIHAVAGNKRGSHLALTLERLEHVAGSRCSGSACRPPSARSRPSPGCWSARAPTGRPGRLAALRDRGRRPPPPARPRPGLPGDELGAVASAEQMAEILDLIAGHVQRAPDHAGLREHPPDGRAGRPPARRAAGRGPGRRASRQPVQGPAAAGGVAAAQRDLRALVATASLELGIDIGPVELVCQIGSPRSFATFLQRVGRSNHTRGGIPAGRLYPTSRDELVECAALLRGARAGRLDALHVPACPLDILAQQVVAECAAADWAEDDLLALARRAAPVRGPVRRGLRRRRRPGLRRDPDRPRPAGRLPAPGPGDRAAARPAGRPPGRAHLGRGHPRAG